MRFSASTLAAVLLAGASTAFAEKFVVTVGKAGALLYEPSSVIAKAGDVVEFQFMAKNHTVTQSTFDKPCDVKAEGVDSGHQLVPAGTTVFPAWSITVQNASAPLWFFCNQPPHCARGMVFAINPTAEKTFDKFKANAAASAPPAPANGTTSAAGSYGGAAGSATTSAPATSTPAATSAGGVIPLTTSGEAAPTAAANAGAGASENLAVDNNNGALSRVAGVAGWPVVLGSVILGALVL